MAASVSSDAAGRARRAPLGVRRVGRLSSEALLIAPIALAIALVVIAPMANALFHSFTAWAPGYESPWVGIENYKDIFGSRQFQQLLLNQAFLLIGVPLWLALPLAISFVLYRGVHAPGLFRALFFFPAITSPALIGILFSFILAPAGPLNSMLGSIGLSGLQQDWLGDQHLVKPVLIAVLAWATMGLGVVLFSAALSAVPPELFESAEIDGASFRQQMWHIVLPSIRPVVELWTVILVIIVFTGVFPWIYTMTRGGPGYSSTTLDWDVYQNALAFGRFDLAAAESALLLAIVAIVIGSGSLLARRRGRA